MKKVTLKFLMCILISLVVICIGRYFEGLFDVLLTTKEWMIPYLTGITVATIISSLKLM